MESASDYSDESEIEFDLNSRETAHGADSLMRNEAGDFYLDNSHLDELVSNSMHNTP